MTRNAFCFFFLVKFNSSTNFMERSNMKFEHCFKLMSSICYSWHQSFTNLHSVMIFRLYMILVQFPLKFTPRRTNIILSNEVIPWSGRCFNTPLLSIMLTISLEVVGLGEKPHGSMISVHAPDFSQLKQQLHYK